MRYAYDCEQKLVKKVIPKMIESSGSSELPNALEQRLDQTRNHAARLERIFAMIGSEPQTGETTSSAATDGADVHRGGPDIVCALVGIPPHSQARA